MTKTTVYCDHCGEELDTMHDYCDIELNLYSTWFNTDLCNECYRELSYKIKQFCNKVDDNNA